MDCKYVLISDTYSDDTGTHIGYGIAAVDRRSVRCSAATDLSTNESEVAELVRKCNKLELSLEHFKDVIEDFLS